MISDESDDDNLRLDRNDFYDETPAVRSTKKSIVRKKRVAKETMKSNK